MAETLEQEKTTPQQRAADPRTRRLAAVAVLLMMVLIAGIRWRLRSMPLERDEGEYAYAGQLILEGIPPYQLAYNMKLPGTYAAYALLMRVFGETASGVHIGLLAVNACATALLFFLARRKYGDWAGAGAAAGFALLSTSEGVLGLAGHATQFVVLMALAGLLFLPECRGEKDWKRYFAAGVSMGLALLMKQPGMVFLVFGGLELLRGGSRTAEERRKLAARLAVYSAGAVLPYLVTCVWLSRAGVFRKFWFWTVSYAREYATSNDFSHGLQYLLGMIPGLFFAAPIVWCFAAIGIMALFVTQGGKASWSYEISLAAWSFLGTSVGLYYRDHYFVLMLPAVCLLAGKALQWCGTGLAELLGVPRRLGLLTALVMVLGLGQAVFAQRAEFFEMSPERVVRQEYGGNPFPEAVEIGKYIREHSVPEARVAVLGSEPEIYFYSRRHSATGYIYTYPLMEEQKYASLMQQEMIGEIEQQKPDYLVNVIIRGSWLRKSRSDTAILYWADRYIAENYRVVGVADVGTTTTYHWDEAAVGYRPISRFSVFVYRRKI